MDLNSTPGSLEEDEVFFEKDFKNADFAAPDDGWFELSINTDDVGELEAGYLYIFAFDAEAYPGYGIGMGRSTDEYSNDDIWQRGWYGVSNSTIWNPIAGTFSIGFRVMVNRYQMAGQEPIAPTHTEVRVGQSKVSGVTVTLTGLELQRLNLPIKLTSTELVLRQPIKAFAKTETYSLLYDIDERLFYHPGPICRIVLFAMSRWCAPLIISPWWRVWSTVCGMTVARCKGCRMYRPSTWRSPMTVMACATT
ncbi:hypothetical protein ACJJIU_10085 [Microbulbifer sp. CnH-101-E]|uniref:hypothetical protein n=1 Tax=unclassified Microbulbifer TaxID=2619833 RepID=UPI004039D494